MICSVFGRLIRLEGQWQREATENVLDFIMVKFFRMDFVTFLAISLLAARNEVVLKRFLAERRKLGHEFQNEFKAGKLNLAINRDTIYDIHDIRKIWKKCGKHKWITKNMVKGRMNQFYLQKPKKQNIGHNTENNRGPPKENLLGTYSVEFSHVLWVQNGFEKQGYRVLSWVGLSMFSNANPFLTSSLWLFPRFFGFLSRFLSSFFPFLLLDDVSASSRIVSGCVSTCHPSCPSSCLLSSLSAFSPLVSIFAFRLVFFSNFLKDRLDFKSSLE